MSSITHVGLDVHKTTIAVAVAEGGRSSGGGGRDVFVHISAVEQGSLAAHNEGQTVEYEIESNRGQVAVRLKIK